MSILSGIGQLPQIFGGNGGGNGGLEEILYYPIPSNIDMVVNDVGYIMPAQTVPDGEYLVQVGLSIECNDTTTNTEYLSISLNSTTQTVLYNNNNLSAEWYPSYLFYATVTGGSLAIGYVLQQTGNTGGYNINLTAQVNGSEGVTLYKITYPIL